MLISTKGRYAVRFLLDLAMHDTGEPVRIREVAKRQEISEKYLEQVVSTLNKAGFLRSVRGPQGGYRLAHETSWYTMEKVLRLTEGSLAPVACLVTEENPCSRADECITLLFWKKMNDAIHQAAEGTSLADLVEWQRTWDDSKQGEERC